MQSIIFRPEVIVSAAAWNAVLGVVIELLQALLELRTVGDLLQVVESYLILRLDPRESFGRVVIFKPAIGIGDFDPVIVVDLVVFAG